MNGIAVKKKEANRWAGVFQGDLDSVNKGSCCGGTGDWGAWESPGGTGELPEAVRSYYRRLLLPLALELVHGGGAVTAPVSQQQ